MAPFAPRREKLRRSECAHFRPVNVGQSASTRNRNVDGRFSFDFGSSFSSKRMAADFRIDESGLEIDPRNGVSSSRCHEDKTKREHRSRGRAVRFSLFEVASKCAKCSSNAFRTQKASNRRFDATLTYAPRCRSRSPSSRFPGSSLCPSGLSAYLLSQSSAAPAPPRPLCRPPSSHVARETEQTNIPASLRTQRGQLAGENRGARRFQVHDPRFERLG